MKTFLLIFFAVSVPFYGQDGNKCKKRINQIIVYDLQRGEYTDAMVKPCIKVPTIFKIKNVNPLYYSIQIEAADRSISYLNEDQQELENYKTTNKVEVEPLVEGKNYNITHTILSSLNKETAASERESNDRDLYIKKGDSLVKAKNDLMKIEEAIKIDSARKISLEQNLQNLKILSSAKENTDNTVISDAKTNLLKINQNLADIAKKINNDSIRKATLQLNISELEKNIRRLEQNDSQNKLFKEAATGRLKFLYESFEALKSHVNKIIKVNQNYNNYLEKVASPYMTVMPYQNLEKVSNDVTSQEIENSFVLNKGKLAYGYKLNNDYPQFRQKFFTNLNNLVFYLNSHSDGSRDHNLFITIVTQEIERMRLEVIDFEKIVGEINLSKRLNQVEILNRILKDSVNYEYVSHPIQGLGDYLEFKINIKSRKKQQNYFSNEEKEFRYFEYLRGGLRLDFSAGVVFNFGTETNSYVITNETIVRSSNNRFMPDLGIFVHSSFRGNAITTFGLSLGTSLDLGKFDINSIYVGPSVLIGKKDKFIFTAGPAFRNVEELRPNYQIGGKAGTSNPVDIVTENFKIGLFFAISYNLTTKQKGVMEFAK